jgi:hypothetical protein
VARDPGDLSRLRADVDGDHLHRARRVTGSWPRRSTCRFSALARLDGSCFGPNSQEQAVSALWGPEFEEESASRPWAGVPAVLTGKTGPQNRGHVI